MIPFHKALHTAYILSTWRQKGGLQLLSQHCPQYRWTFGANPCYHPGLLILESITSTTCALHNPVCGNVSGWKWFLLDGRFLSGVCNFGTILKCFHNQVFITCLSSQGKGNREQFTLSDLCSMNICAFPWKNSLWFALWSSIFNSNVLEHLGTVVLFWSFLRKVDCNFGIHGSCYSITQFHSSQLHPVRCYPCLPPFFSHQSRWQLSQDEKFMGENWPYVSIIFFVFSIFFSMPQGCPNVNLSCAWCQMHLICIYIAISSWLKRTLGRLGFDELESSKYLAREFPFLSGYTAQGRLNSQRLPDFQFQEVFFHLASATRETHQMLNWFFPPSIREVKVNSTSKASVLRIWSQHHRGVGWVLLQKKKDPGSNVEPKGKKTRQHQRSYVSSA